MKADAIQISASIDAHNMEDRHSTAEMRVKFYHLPFYTHLITERECHAIDLQRLETRRHLPVKLRNETTHQQKNEGGS